MERLVLQRFVGFGATKYARPQVEGAPCAPAVREAVCASTGGKSTSASSAVGAASANTVGKKVGVLTARAVASVATAKNGGGVRRANQRSRNMNKSTNAAVSLLETVNEASCMWYVNLGT